MRKLLISLGKTIKAIEAIGGRDRCGWVGVGEGARREAEGGGIDSIAFIAFT
mgnify:CR=1 FL=1